MLQLFQSLRNPKRATGAEVVPAAPVPELPLFRHAMSIVNDAEFVAADGGFSDAIAILRRLSLEDFGLLMISMPHPNYPNLSKALPSMASADVQNLWTGQSGQALLIQSTTFIRQIESIVSRFGNSHLRQANILDFGCGYGRLLRLLYYYADPANIWGVDAWEKSLTLCREHGLPGHLVNLIRPLLDCPFQIGRLTWRFLFRSSRTCHDRPRLPV